jgi:hypothetical protein
MHPAGFEPAIPTIKRFQIYALDCMVTVIKKNCFILFIQFLAFLYIIFQCSVVYVSCTVFRVIGLLPNEI